MQSFYEKYKVSILRYQKSKKGKIARTRAQTKYYQTLKGKKANSKSTEKSMLKNPDKYEAYKKLNNLFNSGNINNSEFACAICGKQPIEKHHENYKLWFSFIPLCKICHLKTYMGV